MAGSTASATARRRWPLLAGAMTAVAALAVGGYFYTHRAPKLTGKGSIVLADFTNTTGDAVFDDALRQGRSSRNRRS